MTLTPWQALYALCLVVAAVSGPLWLLHRAGHLQTRTQWGYAAWTLFVPIGLPIVCLFWLQVRYVGPSD